MSSLAGKKLYAEDFICDIETLRSTSGFEFSELLHLGKATGELRTLPNLSFHKDALKTTGLYVMFASTDSSQAYPVYCGRCKENATGDNGIYHRIYCGLNPKQNKSLRSQTAILDHCEKSGIVLDWFVTFVDMSNKSQSFISEAEKSLLKMYDFIGNASHNGKRRLDALDTLFKSSNAPVQEPSLKDVYRLLKEANAHTDKIASKGLVETGTYPTIDAENTSIDSVFQLDSHNSIVTTISRPKMGDCFTDGQCIRFRLKNTVAICKYDSERNCLVQGEQLFTSLCDFATVNARIVNPLRKTHVDAWSRCECETSGGWIPVRQLCKK